MIRKAAALLPRCPGEGVLAQLDQPVMSNNRYDPVGGPWVMLGGGDTDVWLTGASDGSLVARMRKKRLGLVLIVPYYQDSLSWAIFRPVETK